MARYSRQFIQQVAQSTDIVDVVSQYVALKKKGKEFVGLCPFHQDHHPSMAVSPAKQIFKCFACGAGGGVFQFVMAYERVTFPEAVRTLAEAAGIPLPKEEPDRSQGPQVSKNDLVDVCTFAARFFRDQLTGPGGKDAIEYACGRGLSEESVQRFGLGYAPDSWDALLQAADKKGISQSLLLAAGLIVKRDNKPGCYDRFRNRLMFPIFDAAGRVIAFGGRAMAEDQQPKYLNSAETIVFDKSSQLYAMSWSRKSISTSQEAVVVEGYLDALIPLQHGIDNVVATMGTSLTDRHARMLSRYARRAVLLFDADTAGAAAAQRAMEVFLAQRLDVRVAEIPEGKDPCDYCLSAGEEALKQIIADAQDALEYAWKKRMEQYEASGGSLADRREAMEDFLRLVVASSAWGSIDAVRRGQLAQHIGQMLNVSPADLQQQMRRLGRQVRRNVRREQSQDDDRAAREYANGTNLAERHVLEVLLNSQELFETAAEKISPEDFADDNLRPLAEAVWNAGKGGRIVLEELLAEQEDAGASSLLVELAQQGARRENYEATLDGAVEHILYLRKRRQVGELKSAGYDDETLKKLTKHLKDADVRRMPKIT